MHEFTGTDGPFVVMSGCLVGGPRNSRPARALAVATGGRFLAPTLFVEEGSPPPGLGPAPVCGRIPWRSFQEAQKPRNGGPLISIAGWFDCLVEPGNKSFPGSEFCLIGRFSGALEVNILPGHPKVLQKSLIYAVPIQCHH